MGETPPFDVAGGGDVSSRLPPLGPTRLGPRTVGPTASSWATQAAASAMRAALEASWCICPGTPVTPPLRAWRRAPLRWSRSQRSAGGLSGSPRRVRACSDGAQPRARPEKEALLPECSRRHTQAQAEARRRHQQGATPTSAGTSEQVSDAFQILKHRLVQTAVHPTT